MKTAEQVIKALDLKPHPNEGGFFRETYRASHVLGQKSLPAFYQQDKPVSTAIYYLLTPTTFSCLHRLQTDEVYRFYLGSPVEMLWLCGDGQSRVITLGPNLAAGQALQLVVPAGIWQGSRLLAGDHSYDYALMGTTMAPGFDYSDYEEGKRELLLKHYHEHKELIEALTRL